MIGISTFLLLSTTQSHHSNTQHNGSIATHKDNTNFACLMSLGQSFGELPGNSLGYSWIDLGKKILTTYQ